MKNKKRIASPPKQEADTYTMKDKKKKRKRIASPPKQEAAADTHSMKEMLYYITFTEATRFTNVDVTITVHHAASTATQSGEPVYNIKTCIP